MTTQKGKIIVLVAPSGSGKTTIGTRLLHEFEHLTFSVSATTRPPREGEKDGINYHFLSPGEFQNRIDEGDFIEWEEFYGGKRYGTLQSEVEKQLKLGYFILLDVEVKGALNVKRLYNEDCLSIFIKPPSLEVLKQRLIDRGTEDDDSLDLRLERAEKELTYANKFDQIVLNDDLETAYSEVKSAVLEFMNLK